MTDLRTPEQEQWLKIVQGSGLDAPIWEPAPGFVYDPQTALFLPEGIFGPAPDFTVSTSQPARDWTLDTRQFWKDIYEIKALLGEPVPDEIRREYSGEQQRPEDQNVDAGD